MVARPTSKTSAISWTLCSRLLYISRAWQIVAGAISASRFRVPSPLRGRQLSARRCGRAHIRDGGEDVEVQHPAECVLCMTG